MAAKETSKPTENTKAAPKAEPAVAKVPAGETDEGKDKPAAVKPDDAGLSGADLDKALAAARKEGFDAGREEALEELAEQQGQPAWSELDAEEDDYATIVGRGIILGIILKMPENYRLAGEKGKLDEIDDFLQSIEHGADRVVAVEIIKSLAENRPTELSSPAYQKVVHRALALVHGDAPIDDPHADAANSPAAAFQRMQQAAAGDGNTFPAEAIPQAAPEGLQGEELEAFNRMQRALNG